jgi:predicted transcriptional regulator YdeE
MSLNLNPIETHFPQTHYVFIEAIGPFQNTARKAWQDLHSELSKLQGVKLTGFMSLYKIEPQMIYRAGVVVDKKPENLPHGFSYCLFEGGKYDKFVLTGSYAQLPEACGKVFNKVKEMNVNVRKDFYIENYVNDPKSTPEEKLVTEIMIPVN